MGALASDELPALKEAIKDYTKAVGDSGAGSLSVDAVLAGVKDYSKYSELKVQNGMTTEHDWESDDWLNILVGSYPLTGIAQDELRRILYTWQTCNRSGP